MGKQRKVVLSPGWLPRGCKGEGKGEGFINDLGFILLEMSRGQGNLRHFYLLSCIISAAGFFIWVLMVHLLLPRNAFEGWFSEAVVFKKAAKYAVWWLEHGAGKSASCSRFCLAHIWDRLLATAVDWLSLLSGRFFCLTHPLGWVCQVFHNLWLEITRSIADQWCFKRDASNNFFWLQCKRWLQFAV